MGRFCTLLLAILFAGCSYSVRGIVRDKTTGNPISGAGVTIGDRNATTGATGMFYLEGVHVGHMTTMLVNAPGYYLYNTSVAQHPGEGRDLARDVDLMAKSERPPGAPMVQ